MEHAQKMILVPQDSVNGLREAGNFISGSTQTPGNNLSRLDAEMREILNSREITDERERWKLYNQVLQKYLYFTANGEKQQSQEIPCSNESNDRRENEITEEFISKSVPERYRRKAVKLLARLRPLRKSKAISWNRRGEVSINGLKIKDSNIIDLINDAARLRKSFNPIGKSEFARFIREQNIPREFVGNEQFWAENGNTVEKPVRARARTNSAPPPESIPELVHILSDDDEDDAHYSSAEDDNVFTEPSILRAPKKKNPSQKKWEHLSMS